MTLEHRRFFAAVGLALAIGTAGCVAHTGTFTASSFHQDRYGYDVRYENPASRAVLSPEWRLDNYYSEGGQIKPRTDGLYKSEFDFDVNNDGSTDAQEDLPTYDLRFEHLRTAGVIWLRSIPIATYESAKDLRVMMQDYVDGVANVGYEVAHIGPNLTISVQRRYAAQIVDLRPANLAGHEALAAVIDVANIEQLRLAPSSRRTRVKLVLVRANLTHTLTRYPSSPFPVILLAGYANQPEYFEQNLVDFNRFLSQIVLHGYIGYAEQAPLPLGQTVAMPGAGAPPAPFGPASAPGALRAPGAPAASPPPTATSLPAGGAPAAASAAPAGPAASAAPPGASESQAAAAAAGAASAGAVLGGPPAPEGAPGSESASGAKSAAHHARRKGARRNAPK